MKPLSECRLYTFVDTVYLHGRAPEVVAQQLCDGGSDLIQLRAKNSSPEEIRKIAETILPVTRQAGVGLVINDHLAIAMEVGAEFCHLGQDDFFDAGQTDAEGLKLRTHLLISEKTSEWTEKKVADMTIREASYKYPECKIGLSTHAPDQAKRALAAGPDYIAIGPVYATGTKPMAKPVTLEYVHWAAENVEIPWFAIGGITLENIDEVLAAGARRICVVSAILNATDVAGACREFRKRLK